MIGQSKAMTSYRRRRVPGGTYFFTLCLAQRDSTLLVDHIDALRAAFKQTRAERPFECSGAVILPDHLHVIWTLPEGDADFATRWGAIKSRFSRNVGRMGLKPILQRYGLRLAMLASQNQCLIPFAKVL